MAVPARPTSGVPIETAWGQVAHDAAVAMDIQAGYVDITVSSATIAAAAVTFARPFATIPTIVVAVGGATAGTTGGNPWNAGFTQPTAAGFNMRMHNAVAASVTNLRCHWIAYGPRA